MNTNYSPAFCKNVYKKEVIKIENRLSKLLKNKIPKSLYEPCEYVITGGGKRIRPFLVLLSCKSVGGKFSDAYNAAIAVEVLHNFTLVHDDIIDNADKRRGRLSCHKKYDVNTAILAGDNLIIEAYLSLLKDCNGNTNLVLKTFTKGINEICEGQSYDKDFELQKIVTIKEYKKMITKKTAVMLEMSCAVGGMLGNGSEKEIKALKNFGRNLGIAFQIQDDLLDIMGNENKLGKSVGGDLIEGKKTFIFLNAFKKSKGRDKQLLQKVIANKGIKKSEVKIFRELYKKLGVIEETENEVQRYTKLALTALKDLKNDDSKEMFIWLANYLIKRSK